MIEACIAGTTIPGPDRIVQDLDAMDVVSKRLASVLAYASLTFSRNTFLVNAPLREMTQIWLATDLNHL